MHHLQPQDGHRRRVLPDGGQEAALQDRLRVGQGWERSATHFRLPPPMGLLNVLGVCSVAFATALAYLGYKSHRVDQRYRGIQIVLE